MMDIVNMNLEAGQIVEVTTAPSTPPKKLSVPILGLEKFPTQQEIEGQDVRNRRPVRPIDRQRMRPWLMELLDLGNVFGLRWTNRDQGIFQISWRHASRLGWNLETDGDVFERWARHTGIYKEGDPPEPKRWKANFRCALHSLHDVMELTNAVERRGRNACRTYQFLQNNSGVNPKAKSKEKKPKPIEPKAPREVVHVLTYERPIRQPVQIQLPESGGSSDELLSSETESEGSHQDKVIVQRVDPKSGEVGEEEILLHDHDYSGQHDKTHKTIYLRQGVGSIVLHKEVLHAPQLLEDAKAAEALSNLEQLASAAVDSQEVEGDTIMIDANVLSGASNKGSPTKSSSLTEDENALSLKKLLPRLRARIKETERAGGILRKRKYLAEDMEMLGEKRILGHNQYRLKKVKSEADASPPSPTRRRSGSPQKQTKGGTKSKRSRKESEGSASDSTEPLMSSCLLLLEAATRLDKAEKGEGLSDKKASKHGRKGGDRSSNTTVASKKKKGVRSMRFEEEEQEVIEEPVIEGIEESVIEAQEETVIEERVIYPDHCMQIVYDEPRDENEGETANAESEEGEDQAFDILRSALENIGSEMEVSTSKDYSSREMAIMRRKKEQVVERSSLGYNALAGQIVVTEASFAKGLFSGSEIVPSVAQVGSGNRKTNKFKSKPLANKDNIYYVDVRSNGGSICVKQSDGSLSDGTSTVNNIATTSVGQGSSLPASPQIFIAAGQNSSGQQIVLPIKSKQNIKTAATTVIPASSVQQTADLTNIKQTIGGKSFISLGPKGKSIILKSSNSTTIDAVVSSASSPPSIHQIGSQVLPSNVKISTLPIISTLKPIISIPAPTSSSPKKLVTLSSSSPSAVSPKSTSSFQSSPQSGQAVTLVSSQTDSDGQGTKTYYIQPRLTASGELDPTQQFPKPFKYIVNPGDKSATSVSLSAQQSQSMETSSVELPGIVLSEESSSADNVTEEDLSNGTISAQVIIDPVKGPYLQLPNSSTTIPLSQDMVLSTSPTSGTTTQTFTIRAPFSTEQEGSEIQHYSEEALEGANLQEPVELYTVSSGGDQLEMGVKAEMDVGDVQAGMQGEEAELVYTVKSEDGTAYYIPVQGQTDSPVTETVTDGVYHNEGNIQVEVKTEVGDQTCFISPEQLEQANHIIHISQETGEEEAVVTTSSDVEAAETVVLETIEVEGSVPEKSEEVVDEQYSVSVPSSSSMNIDPRAPLVIQEIPLFASSKGESEDQSA